MTFSNEQRSMLMSGVIEGRTVFPPIPTALPEAYLGRVLEARAAKLGWIEVPNVDAENRAKLAKLTNEIAADREAHRDPAEIDAANRMKLQELSRTL